MTPTILRPACARHRPALLALVDRSERTPMTAAALLHRERCPRCTAELTELALTAHALRGLGRRASVEPLPSGAWPRLVARIERSRARARALAWRWQMTLGGLATGSLIVGALVGPLAASVPLGTEAGLEPAGYDAAEQTRLESQAEARFAAAARTGTLPSSRADHETSIEGLRNHPDGLRPGRKEVGQPRPTGQPPAAS